MKTIKITLRDEGDRSVGLMPWQEAIEIHYSESMINGEDDLAEFTDYIKQCLEDFYECVALTEQELKEEQLAYDHIRNWDEK